MRLEFDVFEMLQDGQVLWHSAAASLGEAQEIARQRALRSANHFFVFSQATGQKFAVKNARGAKLDPYRHPPSLQSFCTE
jgi:hypothetical protein